MRNLATPPRNSSIGLSITVDNVIKIRFFSTQHIVFGLTVSSSLHDLYAVVRNTAESRRFLLFQSGDPTDSLISQPISAENVYTHAYVQMGQGFCNSFDYCTRSIFLHFRAFAQFLNSLTLVCFKFSAFKSAKLWVKRSCIL